MMARFLCYLDSLSPFPKKKVGPPLAKLSGFSHDYNSSIISSYISVKCTKYTILYLEIISWRFGYRPKYQPETPLSAREL